MNLLSILPKKWLKSKTQQLVSTETSTMNSVLPQMESHVSISLHRSCKTLSLSKFIQAYCNNDLQGLIISGNPTHAELMKAWNEIVFEYSSLFKTEQSSYLLDLGRDIGLLQHHIIYVDYAVFILMEKLRLGEPKEQSIIDELISMGYPGIYDDTDPEKYIAELDRIISLAKTRIFEYMNLVDEYDRLNKTIKGKKQTEEEFEKNIAMLSKFQHYQIDTETTSVFRYVTIFNNYLAEMKIRQKIPNGYGE